MSSYLRALLFDLGDTIMQEETEVKDAGETTVRAELIPGMSDALRECKARGYPLGLVADSRPQTPLHVLRQHRLLDRFDVLAISELVGATKPDPRIFRAALDRLGIAEADYGRVVMVGNNLERDVVGANRLGLISVFFHSNERRRTRPLTAEEQPRATATTARELLNVIDQLESNHTSEQPYVQT